MNGIIVREGGVLDGHARLHFARELGIPVMGDDDVELDDDTDDEDEYDDDDDLDDDLDDGDDLSPNDE